MPRKMFVLPALIALTFGYSSAQAQDRKKEVR